MSKTSKFIIPGIIALGSTLFADDGCPSPQPPKPECPSKCAQLSHPRGPQREITPNAGPCVSDGADLFVTADFIYWTARIDHDAFAITTGTATSAASSSTPTGSVAHPNWKFAPGFKVGLGLDFDHDGWDLYAKYTWYRVTNTKRTVTPKGRVIQIADIDTSTFTINSASGKWKLEHFNVIDLQLGRNFYISRYLMLRPYAGMKGTWQKQEQDNSASGDIIAGGTFTVTDSNENKYWGIGIEAGLETSWHFTKSFSMIGNLSATGLWENFKVSRNTVIANSNGTFTVPTNVNNNFHTIKPVIEWNLGLRWETWFYDDNYHFSVDGSWEMQYWAEQNQFFARPTTAETRQGDLTLQGFTLHLRFDF